jgi:hypothetical protein
MQFIRHTTNRQESLAVSVQRWRIDRTINLLSRIRIDEGVGARLFPTERWDSPKFFLPYMQDAIIEKSSMTFKCSQFGVESTGLLFKTLGLDEFTYMECFDLCNTLELSNSTPIDVSLLYGSARRLYDLSLKKPITSRVTIDRNPFDTEFSVWYLLVDLIQLPKLAVSLLSKASLLRSIKTQASLKDVANDHLAIQFGLLPTIADLKEFLQIITKWGRKYAELGTEFTEGFRIYGDKIPLARPFEVTYSLRSALFPSDINLKMKLNVGAPTLYSAARYYFVCPELTGILSRIKQFIDQAGLLDPAALWDLVPWSFIIDWFFDIGPWIHKNLKPQLLPADVVLCDWCESIGRKIGVTITASILEPQILQPMAPDISADVVICTGDVTQYARKRQFPAPLIVNTKQIQLQNSIVDIRRSLIGTALIVQGVATQGPRVSSKYRRRHSAAFSKKWGGRR